MYTCTIYVCVWERGSYLLVYCSALNCKRQVIRSPGWAPSSEINPDRRGGAGGRRAGDRSLRCSLWLAGRLLSKTKLRGRKEKIKYNTPLKSRDLSRFLQQEIKRGARTAGGRWRGPGCLPHRGALRRARSPAHGAQAVSYKEMTRGKIMFSCSALAEVAN